MIHTVLTAGATLVFLAAASPALADTDVSVKAQTRDGITTFSGDVDNGPRNGMVRLQLKDDRGWRTVVTSDFTPKGYVLKYDDAAGTYRVSVPLRAWHDREKGPRVARSERVTVGLKSTAPEPRKWVVGVGDSYMSGEGASYAGYGPWCGNQHTDLVGDCSRFNSSDTWWVSAFGSSLKQTYPGDYAQPIAQPGLPSDSGYSVEPYGVKCHRSSSALMFWNEPGYAAVNLACSGAVVDTRLATGKPGIDFTDEQTQTKGRIVGQALQLQRFAQQVVAKGDTVSTVSMSIGGNDVGFADIIADCVQRYLTPGSKACWRDNSDSTARKAYNNGKGLTAAKDAVLTGGRNIVKALDTATVQQGSYRLVVHTPPIGIPPANEFETDFGGDSGYGRQGIGGCGFTNGDLDFFNGDFGRLLRQRMVEGAQALRKEFPSVKVSVVDGSKAFADHQLCSRKLTYPKIRDYGNNTLAPAWTGNFGGRNGTWMTPIIITCMGLDWGPVCTESTSPAVTVPNLWKAVDGGGAYRSDQWKAGVDQMSQLPAHPNYWGQRALASCNKAVATDDTLVGKVVTCTPSSNQGLDGFGRPFMKVAVSSAL